LTVSWHCPIGQSRVREIYFSRSRRRRK
jgi:hypothetical protein